jgi:hypothetical protein
LRVIEWETRVPASPGQLQSALSYCMDFARTMLEDSGEFHPFGAKVDTSGQLVAVGGLIEGQEHPRGQEVYELLMGNLRSELADGRAIAIAVAANVNIPDEYSPRTRTACASHWSRLATRGLSTCLTGWNERACSTPRGKSN